MVYPWQEMFCSVLDIVGPGCLPPSLLKLPDHKQRPDFGGIGTRAGDDAGTCQNFEGGKL